MATLTSDELPRHLAQKLHPMYVVHGDAPLLAIEAADGIRAAARQAGYVEREVLTVEQHFKWHELNSSLQNRSLFDPRKLVELRIPSGKPGVEGAAVLQSLVVNDDILLLITLPKLEKAISGSKWFAALQSQAVSVAANDVPRAALPDWIAGRLRRQNQTADRDTLAFLADRCEGNLLAAFQEIQKLALLFPVGALPFDAVRDVVMDVARYDVFKLSEAMLKGDAARFAHILDGLRAEGTASVLVLWSLNEELQTLGRVFQAVQAGAPLSQAVRDARVWGAKQPLIEQAATRSNYLKITQGLQHAFRVDKTIKGLQAGDVWDELLQLGLRFAKP